MRFVIQCVRHSSVVADGVPTGKIGRGLMVLCGIAQTDTKEIADKMVKKLCNLRIFKDENGKTNLCRSGNRPGFSNAGKPEMAKPMYEYIMDKARAYVPVVEHGVFGAHMDVELLNDGPFTIILDSDTL